MEKFMNVLLNPSKTIRHVHCCAPAESGKHFQLKQKILDLNKHNRGKDCLVVAATCKYATSLPLLLQDLGDGVVKKEVCKNIDIFMDSMMTRAENEGKKRIILAVFASESLHNMSVSSLTAFLSIPSANSFFRILTVSDSPWGFSEHTEAADGCRPVEILLYDSAENISKQLVTTVVKQTGLDERCVNLVIQSVSDHILDPRLISKICLDVNRLAKETRTERDKIDVIAKEVRSKMNELEARVILKPKDKNGDDILDMPILDQLLLLASFCATHNSSASDKRFFVKHHGKEKRNENRERAVELAAEQKENGPKAADAQRITFIFQAFLQQIQQDVEKREKIKVGVFDPLPQLASLDNTSQATRSSSYANIDQPKVKCMISNETAQKIAKYFGLELKDYLERPVSTM